MSSRKRSYVDCGARRRCCRTGSADSSNDERRPSVRRVEHFADAFRQLRWCKWLLEEVDLLLNDSTPQYVVVGVAGHVQHSQALPSGGETRAHFAAASLRPDDIRQQEVNSIAVALPHRDTFARRPFLHPPP